MDELMEREEHLDAPPEPALGLLDRARLSLYLRETALPDQENPLRSRGTRRIFSGARTAESTRGGPPHGHLEVVARVWVPVYSTA